MGGSLKCHKKSPQGGPEPSILEDLCLADVISKHFSKLRFGTNKFQPELKCLKNILQVFMNPFLRARLCEHKLDVPQVIQ